MPVSRKPVEMEAPTGRAAGAARRVEALAARVGAGHGAAATDVAASGRRNGGGRVSLIGCGPGDIELLTVKAVKAIAAADVILTDDLIDDEVLDLARPGAARIRVGKRGGRASCHQEDINALMVRLAAQGRHVARLKSGDPMLFGRAGEEIAACEAAGVVVEVVPGVSAAFGLAARLKVSLTHRDHAQSVRFVTGHARTGALPEDLDWNGLAHARTTLVVYMGARTAGEMATALMAAGRAAQTPVVLAVGVTRGDESFAHMTLAELAALPPARVEGPVLIGIGAVFASLPASVAALVATAAG